MFIINIYQKLLPPSTRVAGILTRVPRRQMMRLQINKACLCMHVYCRRHHALLRSSATFGTWQHRKLQLSSRYFHHIPYTIARMTGGTVHMPPVSPSGVTPLPLWSLPDTTFKECHVRLYTTKPPSQPSTPLDENHSQTQGVKSSSDKGSTKVQVEEPNEEKLSLVQKFKLMYKRYWYVLIPVHVATSVVWYGSFFIAAKSGVDIVPWLEWMGASESILGHLRNSNAGYYAIAYAMYKIATPARYTVTIGGTTLSINYLKNRGYIKPVPSSDKLKEMYEGKKEEFIERKEEFREKYQERKEEMVERFQEKREEFLDKVSEKKEEIRDKVAEKRGEYIEKVEQGKERIENIKSKVWKGR